MKLIPDASTVKNIAAALVVAAMAVVAMPVSARTSAPDAWAQPDESDLTTHGHYVNHDGQNVHSPSRTKGGAVPPGATAHCGDGSYSFSQHHSGTCSRHGGVAEWE